jgi:hypothetical protein
VCRGRCTRDSVWERRGTQSESDRSDTKSYEGEGTKYNVILCKMGVVGKI